MKVLRSFRLRIALLSSGIAGAVLVAFAAWAWTTVERVTMLRMDDEIDKLARPLLMRPGPPRDWEFAWMSLLSVTGGEEEPSVILLVRDREDRLVFRSENWPDGLLAVRSPSPEEQAERPAAPDGERAEDRRGPGQPDEAAPSAGWEERRDPRRGPGRHGPRRWDRVPMPTPLSERAEFFRWVGEDASWRVGVFETRDHDIALGLDLARHNRRLMQIRNALLGAMALGLVLVGCGGYLVAQRALRPVRVLGATAERVTASGLHERIPLYDEDIEFQRVIGLFNTMMDRLETSFRQATRFSADAAHELKTPLTVLQGMLEEGVQRTEAGSQEQERYSGLLEEVQRLKAITHKLLLLSLADAGQLKPSLQPVDLSQIVEETCEDVAVLAPDLHLEKDVPPEIRLMGDPDLLRQVVRNLATNAVQHNIPDGTVAFRLGRDGSRATLTISNTGQEIPETDRERVFDRFYRVDKARSREKGGAGLGLSLSREIARAHSGSLTLDPCGQGITQFTLTLPLGGENGPEPDAG